jgi:predicted nucleic acid-binding protein
MRLWVVDTSPLVFLAKLDRLHLLESGADRVVLPPTVLLEVSEDPVAAKRRVEAARRSWLRVQPVADQRRVDALRPGLDIGEAEVIALAQEAAAERVVLDDPAARRFARRIGVATIGTLGLLLAAKLRGDLPSLGAEIERLWQAGFRIDPELTAAVLREAGE